MINLIFDYDGTIHNSLIIYSSAFRKANNYLIDKKLIPNREYTNIEISKWLGFSAVDMWNDFAPELNEDEKLKSSNIIGDEMIRLINKNKAKLYKNAEYTLGKLKDKGYNLIFLSNCKISYMENHRRIFKLDRFFSDYYCSEEYNNIPKYEIFEKIKKKYKGEFIIIGDRYQDIEVAQVHNLKSIGCNYGYGNIRELESANFKIESIEEILNIL